MSAWIGFRQMGVPYKRAARFAGATKYPFKKMFRLALEAVTGFSTIPLQIATYLGFLCIGVSLMAILVMIVLSLIGFHPFTGMAVTLIAIFFLGGVQLISLGIIGEYLGRIYDEARGRPLYITRVPEKSRKKNIRNNEAKGND
jgi:dolichol-phosphate mannosyltransferase